MIAIKEGYIGIAVGIWMGLGIVVMLDYLGTGLGMAKFVNWKKLGRRGYAIVGLILLPWVAVLAVGSVWVLFVHVLKEIRDVIFYPKQERTTPIFKALKWPFIWIYRKSTVKIRGGSK